MEVCTFDYSGRVVLVTGGTAGIGLAIAQGGREAGARVFVTGRKTGIEAYGADVEGCAYLQKAANDAGNGGGRKSSLHSSPERPCGASEWQKRWLVRRCF